MGEKDNACGTSDHHISNWTTGLIHPMDKDSNANPELFIAT